jgi:hypothetical protein
MCKVVPVLTHDAMKTWGWGGGGVKLHASLYTCYPLDRGLDGPRRWSGRGGEEKSPSPSRKGTPVVQSFRNDNWWNTATRMWHLVWWILNIYSRAVCKVRGLVLLLRVGTLWRCGDGLSFEVPPLESDTHLTTLHPLLENVLQTVDHFEISCPLGAPFSWLEKPRELKGRDLDCMADVPMGFRQSTFSKLNTEFSGSVLYCIVAQKSTIPLCYRLRMGKRKHRHVC